MKLAKFLAYCVNYILYLFSFLIPRTTKKWAFGSYRGAFNDNSKYLFIYACEHRADVQVCWLSINRDTVQQIRQLGLPAKWVFSISGMWFALRAKYWFFNAYCSDILFGLSGGAQLVNLWHGVPIKCIEFCITQGELAKRYVEKNFWDVFYHPASFIRPTWMASTTEFYDDIFSRSFRIRKSQCMHTGCPRNRMLLLPQQDLKIFVDKYETDATKQLIQQLQAYEKVFVYMPTWRDSQRDCFANGFDLDALNQCAARINSCVLMKPHANTIVDSTKAYSHLYFIDGSVDMYCILPFTDVLITDYSSIMYDYMLMPDKQIILFHYDYEEYIKEREFFFDIDKNAVGTRVYTFADLLHVMEAGNYVMDEVQRLQLLNKFWGHTMDSNQDVCANILKFINC